MGFNLSSVTSGSQRFPGAFCDDSLQIEIPASQNNFAPEGFAFANLWELRSKAAVNLTGLAGGLPGRQVRLSNVGLFSITLVSGSGSSVAANRFNFGATIASGQVVDLIYSTALGWAQVGLPSSGAGGANFYVATNLAAGSTNDFAPTGFDSTTGILNIDPNAGESTLTGLLAGVNGQRLTIINASATNALNLNTADAGSAAANQFQIGVNLTLEPKQSASAIYSGDLSLWIVHV
jgi:hypothetical protein